MFETWYSYIATIPKILSIIRQSKTAYQQQKQCYVKINIQTLWIWSNSDFDETLMKPFCLTRNAYCILWMILKLWFCRSLLSYSAGEITSIINTVVVNNDDDFYCFSTSFDTISLRLWITIKQMLLLFVPIQTSRNYNWETMLLQLLKTSKNQLTIVIVIEYIAHGVNIEHKYKHWLMSHHITISQSADFLCVLISSGSYILWFVYRKSIRMCIAAVSSQICSFYQLGREGNYLFSHKLARLEIVWFAMGLHDSRLILMDWEYFCTSRRS